MTAIFAQRLKGPLASLDIMQITRRWIKNTNGSYTLDGTVLDNVEKNQVSLPNHN